MVPFDQATILGKYRISYFHCESCGFLRTERPYWLAEAYSSAIAASDTGIVARNIRVARILASILFLVFRERGSGKWLDHAGGYGLLTRLMRDKGFDFYWQDKYATNLFAQGFESGGGGPAQFEGVTAIEVLEHAEDPMAFLTSLLALSRRRTLIFTTEVCPTPPPKPRDWWYFGLNTGQHISFFQRRTLETIADKLRLQYRNVRDLHIFSDHLPNKLICLLAAGRLSVVVEFIARRLLASRVGLDHASVVERQSQSQSRREHN